MTYVIEGLCPDDFAPLFEYDDAALAAINARRVTAAADRGYPCRISLEDAKAGEELILLHHISHDVDTPYRSAYAIYVRSGVAAATYHDELPPVFAGRPFALRAFDADGMLQAARLAGPGEADGAIRDLFAGPGIAYIDAHNAAYGCFAARIERDSAERSGT
ncbi:hypothetical protein FHR22_003874 [Sphingopyxis panaciterrae]|uniref:DUF1203 domain-containing protein n=1 Tax=Sphingopyxis panaciterrae TaxID=363841 RepID=UPI0014235F1C|nr:DUF1203 domain-containing protein [Sphingopyxis panaciterrae]NIJ39140.1 hypothetical protein [Sphingopyxis panaciterrae]